MNNIYYVAVYEWGDNEDSIDGTTTGVVLHLTIDDLYAFDPEAIGYYEVMGDLPTENEFKRKHGLKSDAV
jgi:hypothetical protein